MSWQLGLARIAALTGGDLQAAARRAGGGAHLWQAPVADLRRWMRVDPPLFARIAECRRMFDAVREEAALAASGISHLPEGTRDFPGALADLPDPPFGLFVAGRPLREVLPPERPAVAVIGSRRASAFGLRFAHTLAAELCSRGATVISGLALGIDAAAHEGALEAAGRTVAVVGAGVDVVSPRRNARLRERILHDGTVVGEYWPGTPPAPWRFPARNRIIAGMADAVVVVEAGERSGALITADFALEVGRPVLAVPGMAGAATAAGCHGLVRAGAALCERAEDVVHEVGGRTWEPVTPPVQTPLTGVDARILALLNREPLRADELADLVGDGAAAVAAALARLELSGYVVRGHAQRFWAAPLGGAA